jgi:hypothetical protein
MTTLFSATRDDIIKAALRECGSLGIGQSPEPEVMSNAAFALNIIIKAWVKVGMPLWKVVDIPIPLVAGNVEYQIGPTAVGTGAVITDRPLRILEALIRTSNNQDTILTQLSRQDYEMLGNKFTGSIPNSYYYQPLIPNGLLTIYPPTSDITRVIHLFAQVPLGDVNLGTDVVDFPNECYQALKWNLADEVGGESGASDKKLQRIERRAVQYKREMEDWSQEEASIYFSTSKR